MNLHINRGKLAIIGLLYIIISAMLTVQTQADPVGLRLFSTDMPHHNTSAEIAIWHPTHQAEPAEIAFTNPVFEGVLVVSDVPIAAGKHPVILLSHGLGGSIKSVAWLAHGLAARGAVVISVSHINSSWKSFELSEGIKHWTRAQDLSHTLNVVFADPDVSGHLDHSRIMAAGFSFGGWTALSMGGARANHAGLLATCKTETDLNFCPLLLSEEINFRDINPTIWENSFKDYRINHVAAIDPSFVWGLEASDLSELVKSVILIGLGNGTDRLMDTDFDSSGFASYIPDAQVLRLVPATHFTAMPLCTPSGEDILKDEKDDPVCTDPTGTDRHIAHQRIIDLLADQVGLP